MSRNSLEKAKDCLEKGVSFLQQNDLNEAVSWLETCVRHLNTADTRNTPEKANMELEALLGVAHCHISKPNPDPQAALKAASMALVTVPLHPAAMYMRAVAFAIPSMWRSRKRFDAEYNLIKSINVNDPSLTVLDKIKNNVQNKDEEINKSSEVLISYPPIESDELFGIPVSMRKEVDAGVAENQAYEMQRHLFDSLGRLFSNHLPDDQKKEYEDILAIRSLEIKKNLHTQGKKVKTGVWSQLASTDLDSNINDGNVYARSKARDNEEHVVVSNEEVVGETTMSISEWQDHMKSSEIVRETRDVDDFIDVSHETPSFPDIDDVDDDTSTTRVHSIGKDKNTVKESQNMEKSSDLLNNDMSCHDVKGAAFTYIFNLLCKCGSKGKYVDVEENDESLDMKKKN